MLRKNIWKLLFHSQDLLRWIINRSCRWTTLSNNKVCLHFILSSNPWNSKSRKDNSALPQLSSSVFGEYSSWLKIAANWRWLFPSYFCSSFKTEEAFQHLVCVCVCVHIYIYVKWSEVKVAQLYLTLCVSMDWNPPGFSVHGIPQAEILEWVAVPFSRGASWPRNWTWVSLIAGRFFTIWATGETPFKCIHIFNVKMKHKLESRLPGEISITSDRQMTPPLWQKVKKN